MNMRACFWERTMVIESRALRRSARIDCRLSWWGAKVAPQRIAIVPGGGNHLIREQATRRLPDQVLRRWPVERYVALARQLVDRGWEVVLTGRPEDAWVKPYLALGGDGLYRRVVASGGDSRL